MYSFFQPAASLPLRNIAGQKFRTSTTPPTWEFSVNCSLYSLSPMTSMFVCVFVLTRPLLRARSLCSDSETVLSGISSPSLYKPSHPINHSASNISHCQIVALLHMLLTATYTTAQTLVVRM